MKDVKIFPLVLALAFLLSFTLSGCNKAKEKDVVSSAPAVTAPEQTETEAEPQSEPEVSSQEPVPESSQVSDAPVSSVIEPTVSSKPETYIPTQKPPITVGEYTVTDPDNARGLSTQRRGCAFGVAKNGKPNQMSVDNQLWFDSLNGVKALALDTVSNDNGMYLTFDCGYEYKNLTASILDTLKAKNVKAAFFCTLSYLKSNPQLVHRMIDEGHIVGNHSATHPDFTTLTRAKMAEELYLFDKYLGENFGYKTQYFRFPGGNHSENTLELVTSVGHKSIFWSLAHADWDTANQPSPDSAFTTVSSRFHSGAVILLHAVSQTNTDILGRLIDDAHSKGYKFKSLDEYFK